MGILDSLPQIFRLSVGIHNTFRNISTNINPLCIKATPVLLGEPLKKKKKMDPAVIRAREERKRKRLEKQIRRLEKVAQQLKPIEEIEVPFKLIDEKNKRLRKPSIVPDEEIERRIQLEKEWSRYKLREYLKDLQTIDSVIYSQQRALDELRLESEELYNEAIQYDFSFLPYFANGPTHTPPIDNYDSPDGEYINVTKKFDGDE